MAFIVSVYRSILLFIEFHLIDWHSDLLASIPNSNLHSAPSYRKMDQESHTNFGFRCHEIDQFPFNQKISCRKWCVPMCVYEILQYACITYQFYPCIVVVSTYPGITQMDSSPMIDFRLHQLYLNNFSETKANCRNLVSAMWPAMTWYYPKLIFLLQNRRMRSLLSRRVMLDP